jgi:hypothetical protein
MQRQSSSVLPGGGAAAINKNDHVRCLLPLLNLGLELLNSLLFSDELCIFEFSLLSSQPAPFCPDRRRLQCPEHVLIHGNYSTTVKGAPNRGLHFILMLSLELFFKSLQFLCMPLSKAERRVSTSLVIIYIYLAL